MKKIITLCCLCIVSILTAQNFTGTWNTTFGEVRLIQEGQDVYGDYADIGVMDAMLTGTSLQGKFTNGGKVGEYSFLLANDGKSFTGQWRWQGETTNRGAWTGTRKSSSSPQLKNDKWSGQYALKCTRLSIEKKINILQKGFAITGKVEGGGNFSSSLQNDLKSMKVGALIVGNTNYTLHSGNIKSQNSQNITLWYGDLGKTGTSEKNAASFSYLKAMSVAEFNSFPAASPTNTTTVYQATNNNMTTVSQGMGGSIVSAPIQNTITNFSGRYKISLTEIYTAIDEAHIYDSHAELYGNIGIRMYGKGNSGQVEIMNSENKPPRIWEFPKGNYCRIKQGSMFSVSRDEGPDFAALGKATVDKNREFNINGDLANQNLEVNIQANLKESDATFDTDFGWKQRSIKVKDMIPNKVYYLEVSKGNDKLIIGFKLEKF